MPFLGPLPIGSITALQIEDVFTQLRLSGELAPKTIWNIYSALRALFRDAVKHGFVATSPCILGEEELGPMVDKDPEWRAGAIYDRDEVSTLMFDDRIPWDRRVYYSLEYLGGHRLGEVSGLRVRHLDLSKEPLGAMLIARSYADGLTKTKTTKAMPVHPVLRVILEQWLREGFPAMFGREPEPDDFVVPRPPDARSRFGDSRDKNFVRKQLIKDLEMLGFRHRRSHDLRRAYISHAQEDGAAPHVLIRLTHPSARKATAFAGYTEIAWADSCAEVAKLRVLVDAGAGALVLAAASGDDRDPPARQRRTPLDPRGA
jgi:integrase